MEHGQIDLTKLYIATALQKHFKQHSATSEDAIRQDMYKSMVDQVLERIPDDQRVLQSVHTFPKHVCDLLSEEQKDELDAMVASVLHESLTILEND